MCIYIHFYYLKLFIMVNETGLKANVGLQGYGYS